MYPCDATEIYGFDKLNTKNKLLAFDTETTGLNPYGSFKRWGFYPAQPFAFSFCDTEGNTAYIRLRVNPKTRQVVLTPKIRSILVKYLCDPGMTIVGHNMSFDYKMMWYSTVAIGAKIEDTQILCHVITGGSEFAYGLKPLCKKFADFDDGDQDKLLESVKENRRKFKKLGWCLATQETHGNNHLYCDYWTGDPKLCKEYAINDAERTMLLYLGMRERLKKEKLVSVYQREMKLFFPILRMEMRGVKVFYEKLKELSTFYEEYKKQQLIVAKKAYSKQMNFRSSVEKSHYFYKVKGYEPAYFTKKGNPSTDGDSLVYFADRYKDKIATCILEYTGADHMITGFVNPYNRFRVLENGEWTLHPNFKQTGPVTGRFSCNDPNLMQVASDTSGRKKAKVELRPREALGPRNGFLWYLPDYKQIEVWVFAFLAQEHSMMKALLNGEDIHGALSKQVWGEKKDFAEKYEHYRKRAKLVMFCKLYGGGIKKVAYLTGTDYDEALKFVNEFDHRVPGVSKYMQRMSNVAIRDRKIVNPFGRIYFMEPNFAYKAVNYMVQGTSADILKEAMLRIDTLFRTKWEGCHILLTLHDELVLEIPKRLHSVSLQRDVITAMNQDYKKIGCPIPLPVEMKIAKERWSKTTDIKSRIEEWKEAYVNKRRNT